MSLLQKSIDMVLGWRQLSPWGIVRGCQPLAYRAGFVMGETRNADWAKIAQAACMSRGEWKVGTRTIYAWVAACEDHEVLGVCLAGTTSQDGVPCLMVEDIVVRPQFRRNGIGRALLIHAQFEAEELGFELAARARIDSADAGNFLRASGYVVVADESGDPLVRPGPFADPSFVWIPSVRMRVAV